MTNGIVLEYEPSVEAPLDLSRVEYRHFRVLRRMTDAEERLTYLEDEIAPLVLPGGMDGLSFVEGARLLKRIDTEMAEAFTGKARPVGPSTTG